MSRREGFGDFTFRYILRFFNAYLLSTAGAEIKQPLNTHRFRGQEGKTKDATATFTLTL